MSQLVARTVDIVIKILQVEYPLGYPDNSKEEIWSDHRGETQC